MNQGEIKVNVKAFGINRLDLEMSKRTTHLGVEVSGEVMESLSSKFKVGDKVSGLVSEGGYQKEIILSENTAFHLPSHLSFEEGAALPESLFTLALNVFELSHLKPQETILIHSATGGIGNLGIKVLKAYGAKVWGTSSRNLEVLKEWGADKVFSSSQELENESVDVILDNSGASQFSSHIKALKNNGRMCMVDAYSGETTELDLGALLDKSLTLTGSLLRPRSLEQKGRTLKIIEEVLLPLINKEKIRPHLFEVFSPAQIQEAHKVLQERKHLGKLIGVHQ